MKSKTSFINKGILRNDFKRFTWIGIAYLLALLFSIPLRILMLHSRAESMGINYEAVTYLRVFDFGSPLLVMPLIIIPVLTGILLFRYLQASEAADMKHALPIRRETFYNTRVLSGIILLFVPLILTALLSLALIAGLGIENINSSVILYWLAVSLLLNLLLFMSSVAIAMFTGMSTVQGVLTYIFLLLPAGLSMLLLHNMQIYIYGFAFDYYSDRLNFLAPLLRLPDFTRVPVQTKEVIVYLLLSMALYFLGRYLYQRRQLETAGNAITFEVLRPIFKYGVTFCSMLLIGSYFYEMQNNMAWTYFGYFLGSLLAYILVEILLNKSLYIFRLKHLRDYGIYSLIIIVLIAVFQFNPGGYENRIPEWGEVESVYLDTSFGPLTTVNRQPLYSDRMSRPAAKAIYTDKDNIASIYALHQQIINNLTEEKRAYRAHREIPDERVCLAYELKNGKRFYRQYSIETAQYAPWLKPIYESGEYKELHYEIFRINPDRVKLIEINTYEGNKKVSIADPELIKQAIAVLRSDIYAQSYEDMTGRGRKTRAHIDISLHNQYPVGLSWEKSYVNFEKWLQDKGLYDQARLLPGQDVSYALVDYQEDNNQNRDKLTRLESIYHLENKPGVLKITDLEELEVCLLNYHDAYDEQPAYNIYFVLKNGGTFGGVFYEADVPGFIKAHFAR